MKILATLLAAGFAALTASAQSFEGTITWTFRTELSGATAKDMQQAQAQMADPAMQAQMQAAMNDPMMKAMMENNPQMKAMMDNMAGGGAGGANPMANMLPKGVTVKIKGANSLSILEGGMAPGETLTLGDKPAAYSLNRAAKTYTTLNTTAPTTTSSNYKVTRTSETISILGYSARKFVVEETGGRGTAPTTYNVWATTEIAGASAKQLARMQLSRGGASTFMNDIEGIPLRMEIATPEMKMTMEVTSVKKESLSDDLFKLPAGFTERK